MSKEQMLSKGCAVPPLRAADVKDAMLLRQSRPSASGWWASQDTPLTIMWHPESLRCNLHAAEVLHAPSVLEVFDV